MKKILLILIGLIILLSIFVFYNNTNPKIAISYLLKKGKIQSGDLLYRVSLYGIIPGGNAILAAEDIEEYEGRKVYHLNLNANPLKIYSGLFRGYAVLDSYVDIQTRNPILFKQKMVISEKEVRNKEVLYDEKNRIMTLEGVKRQILPNTREPLSVIFNIRHMNLDNIKDLEMNINTNQKNYILKGTISHKEILIGRKIYKTAILEAKISRRDKNPYHQTNITVILLKNNEENIPVLIKVFASGFLINAKLIKIK